MLESYSQSRLDAMSLVERDNVRQMLQPSLSVVFSFAIPFAVWPFYSLDFGAVVLLLSITALLLCLSLEAVSKTYRESNLACLHCIILFYSSSIQTLTLVISEQKVCGKQIMYACMFYRHGQIHTVVYSFLKTDDMLQ